MPAFFLTEFFKFPFYHFGFVLYTESGRAYIHPLNINKEKATSVSRELRVSPADICGTELPVCLWVHMSYLLQFQAFPWSTSPGHLRLSWKLDSGKTPQASDPSRQRGPWTSGTGLTPPLFGAGFLLLFLGPLARCSRQPISEKVSSCFEILFYIPQYTLC